MKKAAALLGAFLMVASCATVSPRARIEDRFYELGLSRERSECLADELDERLDRNDLRDVADFLADLIKEIWREVGIIWPSNCIYIAVNVKGFKEIWVL